MWLDYPPWMITKGFFLRTFTAGIVFAAIILGTQTGCVRYVNRADSGRMYPVDSSSDTAFVIDDDYVYYPNYQIYYSHYRHQYVYRDGRQWICRPAPPGVSLRRLQASPSVRMKFHDSPARHHEEIIRQYPRNWSPSRANHERHEDDWRDEHQDNYRR